MDLTFESNKPTKVEGFTDSDYAYNLDNQKSTSRYVFTYGGGAISWRSKLQYCTTLITTKAEYIAALELAKEAIWLHTDCRPIFRLTTELTIWHQPYIVTH